MRAYATANSPQAEVLEVNQSPENGVKVLIDTQFTTLFSKQGVCKCFVLTEVFKCEGTIWRLLLSLKKNNSKPYIPCDNLLTRGTKWFSRSCVEWSAAIVLNDSTACEVNLKMD